VVPIGRGDQPALALDLGIRLDSAGLRVLVDDRVEATAGVKLTDAELLGMPWIVVVGRRSAEGVVEVRDRRRGTSAEVAVDDMVDVMAAKWLVPTTKLVETVSRSGGAGGQVDASQGGGGGRYRSCIGDDDNAAGRRLGPADPGRTSGPDH
jgi:hypothetical protein